MPVPADLNGIVQTQKLNNGAENIIGFVTGNVRWMPVKYCLPGIFWYLIKNTPLRVYCSNRHNLRKIHVMTWCTIHFIFALLHWNYPCQDETNWTETIANLWYFIHNMYNKYVFKTHIWRSILRRGVSFNQENSSGYWKWNTSGWNESNCTIPSGIPVNMITIPLLSCEHK